MTCWPRIDVGLGKPVEEAVVDHRLRTLGGLLGGLEDGQHGAVPGVAGTREQAVAPASQVTCMSWPQACMTGVSWPLTSVAVTVLAYGSPVGLADRQRVHVGAKHHGRAVAVGKQPHDARAADALGDLVSGGAQPLGGKPGRPPLLQ